MGGRNGWKNGRRGGKGGRFEDEHSATEKPETQIVPSLSPRGTKLREQLLTKILPWQQITLSFHNFPYYIQEHSKSLLLECVAPILKHNKLRKYSSRFNSSSHRILLQSIPGTELYRERLVSALAREMQVPLLRLDDDHGCDEAEDDRYDPYASEDYEEDDNKVATFRKGDRVQYVGRTISFTEVNNRTLTYGQRGEVYEVKGNAVGVVFNICGLEMKDAKKEEKNAEILRQAIVIWLHVNDIEPDSQVRIHDCYIALEVLYEILESQQPMIVYFADYFLWPPSFDNRKPQVTMHNTSQVRSVKNMFNRLPEGVVMISPDNISQVELEKGEAGSDKIANPIPYYQRYREPELFKLFPNMVGINPPKDEDLLDTFHEQIEQDRLSFTSEANLKTMHKVLKDHNLSCMNLEHPIFEVMMLKRKKIEKIVGWAVNHYLSSCPLPCLNGENLHIPHDSMKHAISRFMEVENVASRPKQKSKSIQDHEKWLVSAVVHSEDIGVKFDDVIGLESVKKTLNETVVLPMRRPELFSDGNLSRPCKGILLYGPHGTGKTLIAKALATESGANFINITAAAFTSMSFEALFSCARKLAPVIIFLDEVDCFLEPDTNKLNEFMAAWDNWKTKERKRILLMCATNRPFDLYEADVRHMPRRIYVDLPDLENRCKMLKLILNKENLESGFSFEQLAEATEGYSWSDLKNLCVSAAYGPIQEFLEQEIRGEVSDGVPALRPLILNDFIHSKSKVRPSVARNASNNIDLQEWHEQYGEGESQMQQQI